MGWLKNNKTEIQLITAVLLILFGCVITMMAFWVSPIGIVHNSVLWILGQILLFAGSIFGIDYHYKDELRKLRDKEKDK